MGFYGQISKVLVHFSEGRLETRREATGINAQLTETLSSNYTGSEPAQHEGGHGDLDGAFRGRESHNLCLGRGRLRARRECGQLNSNTNLAMRTG